MQIEANLAPEADIKALEQKINLVEKDTKDKEISEKEKIVKQEIKDYIQNTQASPSYSGPVSKRDQAQELSKFQPSSQIGALISLVFEKGLTEAVSVAIALDNPAILDEFHDTLTDRYYEELKKRGIIK